MLRIVVFLFLLSGTFAVADPHRLAAQRNVVFDRLGTDQGLSQALASSFVQDSEGYIWIGTQEGLNRFDGFSFRHYYHLDGDDGSLSHDSIWSLHSDKQGRLWVGTDEGLNLFDYYTESFALVPLVLEENREEGPVYSIVEDDDGSLWVGSSTGIHRINLQGEVQEHIPVVSGGKSIGVRSLALSRLDSDVLWVGTEFNGLFQLEIKSQTLVSWRSDKMGESILDDLQVRELIEDRNGNLWIGTFNGGLSKFDLHNETVEKFVVDINDPRALASNRVRSLLEDIDGNIWVGTDFGMHLWRGGGSFIRFQHDLTNPRSISDNTVHTMYQDSGGVIWVGTFDGVNKWNARVELFPYFKRPARPEEISPSSNVTSFVEDAESNVWIGTFSGLLKWDAAKGELGSLLPAEMGLPDQRVMSLGRYENEVWVGTMTQGVAVLEGDYVVRRYQYNPNDPSSISSNAITGFMTDSKGRFWITTYGGGVNQYLGNGNFRRFPDNSNPEGNFSDSRSMDIVEVSEDEFWIATDGGGVVILNPDTGETSTIRHDPSDATTLASDNLITLLPERGGMWIGSVDNGLNFYDYHDKNFKLYTKTNGLVSDAIYGLLRDEQGRIWISGAKGLVVYEPLEESFSTFDTTHGLQSSDFNSGAYAKLSDGSLAFGGISGFNVFYPSNIQRNTYVPTVVLTDFKLFNKKYDLGDAISDISFIDLNHDDSVFSIGFAALDYTAPMKNRYRYRLEGFDKEWVDLEGDNEVTYTNLDAGNYVFRVQGSNNDGVWNEAGASLAINVKPAPWMTWWAYGIYAAFAMLFLYSLFRWNSDRLKRDAERKYSERLQLYIESLEEASDCILIADGTGELIYANNTITHGLNKTPDEVIGQSLWDVLFTSRADVEWAKQKLDSEGRYHGEVQISGTNGSAVVHEVTIAAVQPTSNSEQAYVGISRDITERKLTEAQLEDYRKNLEHLVEERTEALQKEIAENKAIQEHLADSLQEKELLIKEVHHRVKNNMQVISSLLSIQAEGAGDEVYSNMLNESQQRIKSMALIHETLYQSKDLLKIDFQEYIETLTTSLSRSYQVPGVSIYVDVNVEDVQLDLETAVPCGLVINELVSNSLKHAFHGKEGVGMIDIDFVTNNCNYDLRIADNGVGLPEGFDICKNMSMGMEIVSILTTQLEGKLTAHNDDEGAVFEIKFPRSAHA